MNRELNVSIKLNTKSGEAPLTVGPESLSPNSGYQTKTIEFALTGNRPAELETGRVHVLVEDTQESDSTTYRLRLHRYLGIPYTNADGSAVNYLDSNLSVEEYTNTHVNNHEYSGGDELQREMVTTNRDKTVFYAYSPPGTNEVVGTASTYRESNFPSEFKGIARAMHSAPDINRISGLASKFGTTLENAGMTSHYDQLQEVAAFVQKIPYQVSEVQSPIETVDAHNGDCDTKTILFMAIVNCAPFNTRTAMLLCKLEGFEDALHMVAGVDERDIDFPDNKNPHWVTPQDSEKTRCFPETRYAYTELTANYDIGDESSSLTKMFGVVATSELSCRSDAI